MTRKEKVLAFIVSRQNDQVRFLALRNNPADPAHGGDFYYVVTGNVDAKESSLEAVLREVDEETGIDKILHIAVLATGSEFVDRMGRACHETFYAIITDQEVGHLSVEHIEYRWLDRNDFIRTIRWYGTTGELEELLSQIETMSLKLS